MVLRHSALVVLSAFNQENSKKLEIFDARFVYFLLMEVIGRGNIVKNRIEKRRLDFARNVFGIRLRGMRDSANRLEKFDKIAHMQLKALKARYDVSEAKKVNAGATSSWTVTSSKRS